MPPCLTSPFSRSFPALVFYWYTVYHVQQPATIPASFVGCLAAVTHSDPTRHLSVTLCVWPSLPKESLSKGRICMILLTRSDRVYFVIFLFLYFYHRWEVKRNAEPAQVVLFWNGTGFSLLVVCQTSHLTRSALRSLAQLLSKADQVPTLRRATVIRRGADVPGGRIRLAKKKTKNCFALLIVQWHGTKPWSRTWKERGHILIIIPIWLFIVISQITKTQRPNLISLLYMTSLHAVVLMFYSICHSRHAAMAMCSTWNTCCSTALTWAPRMHLETPPCMCVLSTTRYRLLKNMYYGLCTWDADQEVVVS